MFRHLSAILPGERLRSIDDPSELGRFASFEEAVAAVEKGLGVEGDALTQVYRIDLPGKDQSVIGVGMKATGQDEEDIDESFQMSVVDFEGPSKIAYFPYEILVNGNEVEALHMRFRMAVHFPDLSMMGEHGFTQLVSSPGAIEDAPKGPRMGRCLASWRPPGNAVHVMLNR